MKFISSEEYIFRRSPVPSRGGIVATSQPLATGTGVDILARGGSAVPEDVRKALRRFGHTVRHSENVCYHTRNGVVVSVPLPFAPETCDNQGFCGLLAWPSQRILPAAELMTSRPLSCPVRRASPIAASVLAALWPRAAQAGAAGSKSLIDEVTARGMTHWDWTVIVIYALGMLSVGWYYSSRSKTTEDYLLRWATGPGTLVGAAAGLAVVFTISFWEDLFQGPTGIQGISVLWAMPLSLVFQIAVGMIASLLLPGRNRPQLPLSP